MLWVAPSEAETWAPLGCDPELLSRASALGIANRSRHFPLVQPLVICGSYLGPWGSTNNPRCAKVGCHWHSNSRGLGARVLEAEAGPSPLGSSLLPAGMAGLGISCRPQPVGAHLPPGEVPRWRLVPPRAIKTKGSVLWAHTGPCQHWWAHSAPWGSGTLQTPGGEGLSRKWEGQGCRG